MSAKQPSKSSSCGEVIVNESAPQLNSPAGLGLGLGLVAGVEPFAEAGAGVLPTSAVSEESPEQPHSIPKLSWEKATKVPPTKPDNGICEGR